jgi:NTP pyrophosphatase (non-canonical NTP hydrolase)
MSDAARDVLDERIRQDAKWGEQNHDPFCYLTVLMEEVGETSEAALHTRFGGPKACGLRKEAVQTAAVALAIVECLDRGKWSWRSDVDNNGNPLSTIPRPSALAEDLAAEISAKTED